MAHAQQQILDAVQAAIVAGATAAAARVFVDRVDPLQPPQLPAVLVDEAEAGERVIEQFIDGSQHRRLEVTIACVLGDAGANAAARDLGLAVEQVLIADATLQTLCRLGHSIAQSRQINSGEGERLLAGRLQSWHLNYLVHQAAPETIL